MKTLLLSFLGVVSVVLFALPAFAQASTTFQAADVLGQTSGSHVSFTSNAADNGTTTNACCPAQVRAATQADPSASCRTICAQ
jgi:hypothetical protein